MKEETREKPPLSVAIITKNEEERLPDCLKSVTFADEVLVVDSGSADGTVALAKSFGARVLVEVWRGYSGQKQFAVDQCLHDWVLILDADERIPQETAQVLMQELARNHTTISAYGFRRKNYLHGRWIKHCGWWPDRIVRLVNRRAGEFDGRPVHEKWVTQGNVKELGVAIEHLSFRNYSELLAKMENYSNLASKELFDKEANVNALTPIFHGLWMFLRTYLLELGVLDGFDGLVISTTNAGGSFLKYAKARELRVTSRKES
jgi:(heptosyl)LPS beta-1,4-glucosyltransferase